jgi:hypothetical protein
MADYTIIGQRPTVALDELNVPRQAVEITFRYGNGFTGQITVDPKIASPESIKSTIEDYIARFTVNNA